MTIDPFYLRMLMANFHVTSIEVKSLVNHAQKFIRRHTESINAIIYLSKRDSQKIAIPALEIMPFGE